MAAGQKCAEQVSGGLDTTGNGRLAEHDVDDRGSRSPQKAQAVEPTPHTPSAVGGRWRAHDASVMQTDRPVASGRQGLVVRTDHDSEAPGVAQCK